MKKFCIFLIFFLFSFLFPLRIFALPNWIHTTIGEHFGIWSTLKNSTNEAPSFAFGRDGRLGVAIKNFNNFLSGSIFKAGDVVAQRYCFETSQECVETFQQSFSNNRPITLKTGIPFTYQDPDFTELYTDSSKTMYIKITPDFLNSIGMADEQTSNWLTIGETMSFTPHQKYPRQLWVNGGNGFNSISTHSIVKKGNQNIVYPYAVDDPNFALRGCYYTDFEINRKNILTARYSDCAGGKNVPGKSEITRVDICDKTKNVCGVLRVEYRLTTSDKIGWNAVDFGGLCSEEVQYSYILSFAPALTKQDSGLYSTPFMTFERDNSKNPVCYNGHIGSAIQMRIVLNPHNGAVGSLMSLIQSNSIQGRNGLFNKINSMGVMFLQ